MTKNLTLFLVADSCCEFDARLGFALASGQSCFALAGALLSLLGMFNVDLLVDLYASNPPERD
jgi:hypothetical protein